MWKGKSIFEWVEIFTKCIAEFVCCFICFILGTIIKYIDVQLLIDSLFEREFFACVECLDQKDLFMGTKNEFSKCHSKLKATFDANKRRKKIL